MNQCAKCHGVNGDGKRPPGSMYSYNVQPTDFTRKKLMDSMSDGEMFWKITHGRRPMPAFQNRLSDYQRREHDKYHRTYAHPGMLSRPSPAPPAAQP